MDDKDKEPINEEKVFEVKAEEAMDSVVDQLATEEEMTDFEKEILKKVLLPLAPLIAELTKCGELESGDEKILLKRIEAVIDSAERIAERKGEVAQEDIEALQENMTSIIGAYIQKHDIYIRENSVEGDEIRLGEE